MRGSTVIILLLCGLMSWASLVHATDMDFALLVSGLEGTESLTGMVTRIYSPVLPIEPGELLTVALYGIDLPSNEFAIYPEVCLITSRLTKGKEVYIRLAELGEITDQPIPALVYLDSNGSLLLDAVLVSLGLAWARTSTLEQPLLELLSCLEALAREARWGVWAKFGRGTFRLAAVDPETQCISIMNNARGVANLAGWTVSDGEGFYTFTRSAIVNPGASVTICGAEYNPSLDRSDLWLDEDHDAVCLIDPLGQLIDRKDW